MCGIAGIFSYQMRAPVAPVQQMLDVIASRGPEGEGIYAVDNVCLGHRRLKIIDLSQQGGQPMVDSYLGLTLVFNGCIYNYRALRDQLIAEGHSFFSHSDSEVILKAYAQWGEACLEKFNGMFALAIYQRDTGELFLARDRLGIKPLYYMNNSEGLVFASTLPALLQWPGLDKALDPIAINQYISFRAMVTDSTPFKAIKKLPAGTCMKINRQGMQSPQRYWQLQTGSLDIPLDDEQAWADKLEQALFNSIRRRLEADVPVGVLLSGGVDSSLIVGLLSKLGQKDIHTFSIGFDAEAEEKGNEFQYSDLIAKHFNTRHNKIFASHDMLLDALPDCVLAMSEPMVSHDVIGFYLLSREVSQHVKVVQSGQGADEVFGGYHWYPPMVDVPEDQAAKAYADAYFSWNFKDYQQLMHSSLLDKDYATDFVREYFQQAQANTSIDKTLLLDTEVMLVDDPVKRVDNMTMAFGLEARVPFLDHELVELAFTIPHSLKLKAGGKYLLKQVARRHIPSEVIDRPKGYFPVPALRSMQGAYLALAKEVFQQPAAQQRKLFNLNYINGMLAHPEQYKTPFGSKLWQVTLLELWLQTHGV